MKLGIQRGLKSQRLQDTLFLYIYFPFSRWGTSLIMHIDLHTVY